MKKYITSSVALLFALTVAGFAQTPDKSAVEAKEKAAWQAFKDKNAAEFQKVVDKDVRCVYAEGVSNMARELEDMKKWDMKSFAISNFDMFTDEPDVIVTTYTVKVEGTMGGKDVSGMYNTGSVWKKEGNDWLAIFHTGIKQEAAK